MATIKVDNHINVDKELYDLVNNELTPGTDIHTKDFFKNLYRLVNEFGPQNDKLLEKRDQFQAQIDNYFLENKGKKFDAKEYENFLTKIGYIVPEGEDFKVETKNVDPELAKINGPQLVVPVFIGDDSKTNARYPLNAANARWGSLYNALYGKPGNVNVIAEEGNQGFTKGYNTERGAAVIQYSNEFLDKAAPLAGGYKYAEVKSFKFEHNDGKYKLHAFLTNDQGGGFVGLAEPEKFVGFIGSPVAPESILLKNNGLHIELKTKPATAMEKTVAQNNKTAIYDVVLESAPTTIIDLEDSACAVDAHDKTLAYRNINGLFKGTLSAGGVDKEAGGVRKLNSDLKFRTPDNSTLTLPGRALMLVRNVGIHMETDAVTLVKGNKKIPEGLLDLMVTALSAKHDLAKAQGAPIRNSKTGSVYIVKPKMHGPEEVAYVVKTFERVEEMLGLPRNTLKIGIMDEEQRTSVNLKECLRAAKDRAFFINTGFLDRTGDMQHTQMEAGPIETKAEIQKASWLQAYEKSNVITGIKAELEKVGQIGKGMWAQNKNMKGLVETKQNHPLAGANTAWVPSDHGATLHALHYHKVNVDKIQAGLAAQNLAPIPKSAILELPLLQRELNNDKKKKLLDGYVQSVLGYVARWVDQGIGCSSVPDFEGVYLMEDRATLRIGSQEMANWLKHGVISKEEVIESAGRMAAVVDKQNAGDKNYINMVGNFNGPAFQTSLNLIFNGEKAKNGYVEPDLNAGRKAVKKSGAFVGSDKPSYLGQYINSRDGGKKVG